MEADLKRFGCHTGGWSRLVDEGRRRVVRVALSGWSRRKKESYDLLVVWAVQTN